MLLNADETVASKTFELKTSYLQSFYEGYVANGCDVGLILRVAYVLWWSCYNL
jgi:hypothetical protein